MAKSAKRRGLQTVVDEQGYETDGMYRWGGTAGISSFDEFRTWIDNWNVDFNKPASERIAHAREILTSFIQPHVDGPVALDDPQPFYGRRLMHLNLSTGSGCYAVHEDVPKKGFVNDATDALHELDGLSYLLARTPQNIDRIVRSTLRVGMLITRTELRAFFAPEVLLAKKRRKASVKGGKATAKWTSELADLAGPLFAESKRGKVSDSAACNRTAARLLSEHGVSISARTLKRHLCPRDKDNA